MRQSSKRAAFTLIELLVVVIIVAILAAVGIPLLSANIIRAKASEADAGLGTLRTGMRAYIAEHVTFPATKPAITDLGINLTDLDGRYFDNAAYSVITATSGGTSYCLGVDGAKSGAPRKNEINSGTNLVQHAMDQDGNIYKNTACSGTLIN